MAPGEKEIVGEERKDEEMVILYILRAYQSRLFIILLEKIRIENAAVFNLAKTLVGQCIRRRKGIQKRPLFPRLCLFVVPVVLINKFFFLVSKQSPLSTILPQPFTSSRLLCGNSALSSSSTTTIHITTPMIPRALPPCLTSTSTLTRPYLT
jgi:hypothetical protein